MTRSLSRIFIVIALGTYIKPVYAVSTGLVIESVNNYSGNGNLTNSIANGSQFYSNMSYQLPVPLFPIGLFRPPPPPTWSLTHYWTDGLVWDTDFFETGNDSNGFDEPGTAISYFTGHGNTQFCDDQTLLKGSCVHDSDCWHPEDRPGATGVGACRAVPHALHKWCCYNGNQPQAIVNGSTSAFGNVVTLWSGAITLGSSASKDGQPRLDGTNMVVMDMSHGVTAPFWGPELSHVFSGLHLYATLMPTAGDSANAADRGAAFAIYQVINPLGSVASAWLNTISNISDAMNGYGCTLVVSVDGLRRNVLFHISQEDWYDLQSDDLDSSGYGWMAWAYQCNYDAEAFPVSNP